MSNERNVRGQAIAITVFSTIRWWGRVWLPLLFAVTRRIPSLTETLRELSFIHFARWSIVWKLPYNGEPQSKKRLRYPHMYFESNFNGGWKEYIEAFSNILTKGMKIFWGSSFGFPGPVPVDPFKDYIRSNEIEADHYYSAYPEATATQVQRAIALAAPNQKIQPAPKSKDANVSGQAYAFLAMMPIYPDQVEALQTFLRYLDPSPFGKLPRTHFARFVVIEDFHNDKTWGQKEEHMDVPYLIFSSNFDGDLDSYLDEFCALDEALPILWHCIGFPKPATPGAMKAYLKHNQIDTGLFYAAYGDATVGQVKEALAQFPPSEWQKAVEPKKRLAIERIVHIIRESYVKMFINKYPATRDQHAREHGTIDGTVAIEAVEPELRYGLLAEVKRYHVTARFSPNATVPLKRLSDAHGFAMKIRVGDKVQDLLLANNEVFFCRDAEGFIPLARVRSKGGFWPLFRVFFPLNPKKWRTHEFVNMIHSVTGKIDNPLGVTYYSQTPFKLGNTPVKWAAVPAHALKGKGNSSEELDAAMAEQLGAGKATFDLMVQPQTPGDPINDASVRWKGPWKHVGTIDFPAQAVRSGERLGFTVGNHLPDQVPMGDINQVREVIYDEIFTLRSTYNGVPVAK